MLSFIVAVWWLWAAWKLFLSDKGGSQTLWGFWGFTTLIVIISLILG